MRTYAERARAIQPTGVRKMFDLAGEDTISLVWASLILVAVAIEAFHQAMLDGATSTPPPGLPALRERSPRVGRPMLLA